ncbi:MAG TPA: 3-phosphoshikimate 1-carboxyvinyltransferase [Stellaceae bacterium]|nr:3-phosphoshikimate 1-carboxyvinyltransferase [Stellaceae bacterium]
MVVTPLSSGTAGPLKGRIRVPGDKSISHRALILGTLAAGRTRVSGLLEGDDVLRTAAAMRALGARVERVGEGEWTVDGVGVGGLAEPEDVLDFGNSGTGARLVLGTVATSPITAIFTGDASLRRRPMGRVTVPLQQMGAQMWAREGGRLPLAVRGAVEPMPLAYTLPVPSAQVKSAVLLAGLNAPGETSVREPLATRDHTERMLRHFGVDVRVAMANDGAREITLTGETELRAADLAVPGDPSSAAFAIVAALLLPGSEITIEGVGTNPLRTGLLTTLLEMGARIEMGRARETGGEPVADLLVRASALRGVEVPAERAPSMIDEYPILSVAAAFANGKTVMRGLAELRVKESDRLSAIAEGLRAAGVRAVIEGDTLTVEGLGKRPHGGATIEARLDHRIAMAFLVLGMASERPIGIDDGETINTSFPGFVPLMNGLGAAIHPGAP